MRVLVACEYSGRVRDAFLARGHDAISCDLLPTESPGPHVQGDVLALLREPWDLVVAHPPCTYLALSGVRWLYKGGRKKNPDGTENPIDKARWGEMIAGCVFFAACWNANASRVAVENSQMHGFAQKWLMEAGVPVASSQIVQPWWFAQTDDDPSNVTKGAMFVTRGLPPLRKTGPLDGSTARPECHHASPGPDRWKVRSRTTPAVARALAEQWG